MFQRWLSIDQGKSSLIIGPRRSGKTTLLLDRYPNHTYATLDDLDFLGWAKKDPKGFISHLGEKAVIDEIQRLPKLTIAVKYAIDNTNATFIMTGSSSLGLLDASADTLAGRINIYSLPTLCWGEEKGAPGHGFFNDRLNDIEIKKAARLMNDALTLGQFPEVIAQQDASAGTALLKNYRNTYFTRDVMQLANIENIDGMSALFDNIARSIGSHLEISNFARETGMSYPTTRKYVNVLNQSQLTFKLPGYQFGPAKRHLKAAKTYYADNGIIQSLGVQLSEGQIFENFVIAELEKRRKLGFIPSNQFYYYKSASGREIDLVFESGRDLYAVEVKATARPGNREIRNLRSFAAGLKRSVRLYLIYGGEEYAEIDGIRLIPAAALFRGC